MFIGNWKVNLVENVYGKIVGWDLGLKREKKKPQNIVPPELIHTFGYSRRLSLPCLWHIIRRCRNCLVRIASLFASKNYWGFFLIKCWNFFFLFSNELQLKEELRKWKERALKLRERFSRESTQETVPRSPRKTVSCSVKEPTSPSKESLSQETVTQYISKPLPLTCPTNFFDNSNLSTLTGM